MEEARAVGVPPRIIHLIQSKKKRVRKKNRARALKMIRQYMRQEEHIWTD